MRKYSLFAAAIALVFAVAIIVETAHAQTGGTSTSGGATQGSTSTNSGTSSAGTSSTDMSGQSTYGQTSTEQHATGKQKIVEGCVIRQQSDYFLVPKKGNGLVRLSGQDVSAHLNHHVKVHGTEQKTSASAMGSSATGGGTAGTATSAQGAEATNPAATTGSSTTMAGTTENKPASGSTAAEKMITVESVDMISETCPESIQKNAPSGSISGTNPPR